MRNTEEKNKKQIQDERENEIYKMERQINYTFNKVL